MDLVRKSSPTYAEMAARRGPVTQDPSPIVEEEAEIFDKEYHPWLLNHIPKYLIHRRDLTKIEKGRAQGVSVEGFVQKIFSSIYFHPKINISDKRNLEKRIEKLFRSVSGKLFLEYLNRMNVILSLRKFEKYEQVIVDHKKKNIDENFFPLEWISIDRRRRLDQILARVFEGSELIVVDPEHPQKKEIISALERLTMRPVGGNLLEELDSTLKGMQHIKIKYKKGHYEANLFVDSDGSLSILIDNEIDGSAPRTLDKMGRFLKSSWTLESSIAHECMHALRAFLRKNVSLSGIRALRERALKDVVFSPSLGRYVKEGLPEYYLGFNSEENHEEQQIIMGALVGREKRQIYPITENAIRFCFGNDLRVSHTDFFDDIKGQVFKPYEIIYHPFDFFGYFLCYHLQAAIFKLDGLAVRILLDKLDVEKIERNLCELAGKIEELRSDQKEFFYSVVIRVFEKYQPRHDTFSSLLCIPFKIAFYLLKSRTINREELERCLCLFNYKQFSFRVLRYNRKILERLHSFFPSHAKEQSNIEKLFLLADECEKRSKSKWIA